MEGLIFGILRYLGTVKISTIVWVDSKSNDWLPSIYQSQNEPQIKRSAHVRKRFGKHNIVIWWRILTPAGLLWSLFQLFL